MTESDRQLEQRLALARHDYQSLGYPGDLARDVGLRRGKTRRAVLFTLKVLSIAAVLLLALMVGVAMLAHRAPREPQHAAQGSSGQSMGAMRASLKMPALDLPQDKPIRLEITPTLRMRTGALPAVGSWSLGQVMAGDSSQQNKAKEQTS